MKATQPSRHSILLGIIGSILIHSFLFLISPKIVPQSAGVQKIPIRIVSTSISTVEQINDAKKRSSKSSKKQVSKQGQNTRKKRSTYVKYFPQGSEIIEYIINPAEGHSISNEEFTTRQGSLTLFARDLLNVLQVPHTLVDLQSFGHASTTIKREGHGQATYRINKARGDAYTRALLFERVNELLSSRASQSYLNEKDIERLNVQLTYRIERVTSPKDEVDPFLVGINAIAHRVTPPSSALGST